MSFTILSAIMTVLAVVCVVSRTVQARRKGLIPILIELSASICAMLLAMLLCHWLTVYPSDLLMNGWLKETGFMETLLKKLPGIEPLIVGYVEALLAPFAFLLLYWLFSLIFAIVLAVLTRKLKQGASADGEYENENAAYYRKKASGLATVVGVFYGVMIAVTVTAPVTGTLRVADTAIDMVKKNVELIGISEDELDVLDVVIPYTRDLPSAVLYLSGGGLIYDSTARLHLGGYPMPLSGELAAVNTLVADLPELLNLFSKETDVTKDDLTFMKSFIRRAGNSKTFGYISASFLSKASENWLEGEPFASIPPPDFGSLADPMLKSFLRVCHKTTAETVNEDLSTMAEVYAILVESGMLTAETDEDLLLLLNETNLLNRLYGTLGKNPRMQPVSSALSLIVLRVTATSLLSAPDLGEEYGDLLKDLADSMNAVQDLGYADRVGTLTDTIVGSMKDYGMELPEEIARVTAEGLLKEFEDGEITPEALNEFFEYYRSMINP